MNFCAFCVGNPFQVGNEFKLYWLNGCPCATEYDSSHLEQKMLSCASSTVGIYDENNSGHQQLH